MNWQTLEQEIALLAGKIDTKVDIIVGITRGGLIPARLLSSSLGVKKMFCLSVEKIGDDRKVVTDILENITGKSILLVEDMLESGRSLIVAKQYLESKGAIVKTACLYTMPMSEVIPDFSLKEVEVVVKFPWEK